MTCLDSSRGVYLTYFIQGLILLAAAASIMGGEYLSGLSAAFAFFLTLAPSFATRNMRFCLPWGVNLLIAVSLYLHVMGYTGGYYAALAYYDKLAHLVSSATVALIVFSLMVLAGHRGDVRLTTPAVVASILIATLAAGALWEIYEFAVDQIFGTSLQLGNTDTMWDLIMDLIGAAIVAGFAAFALAREDRFTRIFAGLISVAEPADVMDNPADSAKSR